MKETDVRSVRLIRQERLKLLSAWICPTELKSCREQDLVCKYDYDFKKLAG